MCIHVSGHCYLLPLKQFFVLRQNIVKSLSEKNSSLENELSTARKSSDDTMEKLKDVEGKCTHLQKNLDKYVSLLHTNNHRMLE